MILSSNLSIPIQDYLKDFIFIVNGKEFPTSRIFADMISSRIRDMHKEDATVDTYIIDMQHKGDFNWLLNLCSYREVELSDVEQAKAPLLMKRFLVEMIESLG